MIIYSNLRVKMAERGFSIKDVREKTNLSRTTISNLYNGYSDGIKFNTLEALCDLFNCTPNDLLKVLDVKIHDVKFKLLPLDNDMDVYKFETMTIIEINGIKKNIEFEARMILHTPNNELDKSFEASLYLEDENIIYEDDFNLSSNIVDQVNKVIEKDILKQLQHSKVLDEFDLEIINLHLS